MYGVKNLYLKYILWDRIDIIFIYINIFWNKSSLYRIILIVYNADKRYTTSKKYYHSYFTYFRIRVNFYNIHQDIFIR